MPQGMNRNINPSVSNALRNLGRVSRPGFGQPVAPAPDTALTSNLGRLMNQARGQQQIPQLGQQPRFGQQQQLQQAQQQQMAQRLPQRPPAIPPRPNALQQQLNNPLARR